MTLWAAAWASQVALVVKNLPANAGDMRDLGPVPGLGRSPGEGNGNPLQCSCLENPTEESGGATVRGVTKSPTQLHHFHFSLLYGPTLTSVHD